MFKPQIDRYLNRHGYLAASPRAVLVDMDGTLYDSMPCHAAAWQQMMSEIGVDVPREEFFRYEGRTGASTINILFKRAFGRTATDEEVSRLYHRKTELFASFPPVSPIEGAQELMTFLRDTDIDRVLVTGSGQSTLINRLDSDYPGIFDAGRRITSRDVAHGKPAPEPYIKAMQLVDRQPYECIVLENAPLGVQAGAASGAFTIGINTGPIDIRELADAGADLVFESMAECRDAMPVLLFDLLTTSHNYN